MFPSWQFSKEKIKRGRKAKKKRKKERKKEKRTN
jgi:hypothetical protein